MDVTRAPRPVAREELVDTNAAPAEAVSLGPRNTDHGSRITIMPSVPIDVLLDDHAVEFQECKRWANSEAGQAAKLTNPAGFANVRAHAEAHLRAMTAASPNPASGPPATAQT